MEWLLSRFAAFEGDLEQAVRRAGRVAALGRKLPDPDLEALGMVYEGLWRLALGETRTGTALQDEAAAAALAGAVSPWVGGTVYCATIWGCRNQWDWERAAQWTEQYSRWCDRSGMADYPGLCRLHRAEVLGVVGELERAEQDVEAACRLLSANAPWAEGDAFRVMGELRLCVGDLAAAEACFRQAYALGWDPQPGLAQLHLAQGRPEAAVRSLERCLEDHRWVNGLRHGLLLANLAIAVAHSGDPERAASVLAEIEAKPDRFPTPGLVASRSWARAEVALASGNRAEALRELRRALLQWHEIGAPLHAANLRLRLVPLLAAECDPEGAELELAAAEAAFRQCDATHALARCAELRGILRLVEAESFASVPQGARLPHFGGDVSV